MLRRHAYLVVAVLLLNAGCLFNYQQTDTVRREECPRQVAFESEAAERLFADGLETRKEAGRLVQCNRVTIPFLLNWSRSAELSEAAFFNDQVRICDADGNGCLTDTEVAAYHKRITGKDNPLESYKGILHQQGDIQISHAKTTYEVQFPQPYESNPELILSPDAAQSARVEPSTTGFRIVFKEAPPAFTLHWQADGRPWVPRGSFTMGLGFAPYTK
jgi:hypothetical protein